MYSASGAVRSAVADQQIGDDAVTRRRRLVGRRRAGTAGLDHVDSYTLSLYMTRSAWYIKPMHTAAIQLTEKKLARTINTLAWHYISTNKIVF